VVLSLSLNSRLYGRVEDCISTGFGSNTDLDVLLLPLAIGPSTTTTIQTITARGLAHSSKKETFFG
jgi:hypothetical protein